MPDAPTGNAPQPSNFAFLAAQWPEVFESAARAERLALPDPRGACFYARRTLELAVRWLYDADASLHLPYDDTLSARLHEPTFRALVPREVWVKMRLLKELGNEAVHSRRPVSERDGLAAARELFHALYWLARTYAPGGADKLSGLAFDVALLSVEEREKALTAAQLQALQEQIAERDAKLREREEESSATRAEYDAEIARLRAEVAAAKKANSAVADDHDYSEAQTRDLFIDLLLREACWPLDQKRDREFEVEGMPNEKGKGYVDYVLWGDDGLPLAVVEAKRTRKDPRIGRRQAELYADCLEKRYGRRPLIFYTNGYQHWYWDDALYPPREVQGFLKKDELELALQRRTTRKPLAAAPVDGRIAGRYYQNEAIRAVCEHFEKDRQRRALVVMATGSGKTRTVIALADLLARANWAKRILFLADRVALVNQAANAFKAHLPDLPLVNLVTEKEDASSRVFLSTYPTMMGLIDEAKGDGGGARRFGAGHFDLIVIDEAHRSVYQRYGAIFSYFDALLVGLTATPRGEVDRNTYKLFELEEGVPTYAYELEKAVADGFLVPPRAVDVPMRYPRQGIAYDDLSEDEKDEWDALEWDEAGEVPDKVEAAAVNKWLFNEDTVDRVLAHLMENGIKVDGGDRLAKTIVFAKNHAHAHYICERFDANYPHLAGKFARVIDHFEPYAQSLLDDFATPDKAPHIAVSVDMLDTGIDVPEVANLVFFKLVRSKTKFWQMVGRGTRLCPDLFGPGQDKEYFRCFDYCGNFAFFGERPQGVEASAQPSLSEKLFQKRLALLTGLKEEGASADAAGLDSELADRLHAEVAAMSPDNFLVRPKRALVERFAKREAWESLTEEAAYEVGEGLAGLPSALDPEDITARQFDLLMLNLQLGLLKPTKAFERQRRQVMEVAALLEEKGAVPAVAAQMALIQEVQEDAFWQDVTLSELESVRKKLRDLVKFVDRASRKVVYTDFADEMGEAREVALPGLASSIDVAAYRKKVEQYLREHLDHPAVRKLRENLPVDEADLRLLERSLYELGGEGGEAYFRQLASGKPLGAFVRSLVGLDREAAKKAFARYLEGSTLSTAQIRFVDLVVDYLTKNGTMDPGVLYEQPFTALNPKGLDGIFQDHDANTLLSIVRSVNSNAGLPTSLQIS
jgi:Type I site-specific restriction-modification system, R (restriction) subunit and related helicases